MSYAGRDDAERNGQADADELPAQLARLAADLTWEGDLTQERGLALEENLAPAGRGAKGREGAKGRGRRRLARPITAATRYRDRLTGYGSRLTEYSGRLTGYSSRLTEYGARLTGQGFRAGGRGFQAGSRWLTREVLAMAPRLPVRDKETLRAQFPGRSPEEIADALIEGAARASATVGGAMGVWSVLPITPAFPAEVATETLVIVGIEVKLIAELHEVYGMRASGGLVDRMTAYVAAWARRRGVSVNPGGVVLEMGPPLRQRLRRRLEARAVKSTVSLGPLLTGVAAGTLMNHRETRRLGCKIRDDLRRHSPAAARWHG